MKYLDYPDGIYISVDYINQITITLHTNTQIPFIFLDIFTE